MKKHNGILIYDDLCPLCTWYSNQFVRFNLLTAKNRVAFSTADPSLLRLIDIEKGRNEIPYVDMESGKTFYGIYALLEILGQKLPIIKTIGNVQPVKWFLLRLYKLVSFNRKVIVAKKCGTGMFDCSPEFNFFYRILFMAISLVFNTLMLFPLHNHVLSHLSYYHLTGMELQLGHFSLVCINCFLALNFGKEKAVQYLGQVSMLATISNLLLIPLLLLSFLKVNEILITIYFIGIAALIYKEYLKRMEYAGVLPENKWLVSLNLMSLTGFILFLF